MADINELDNPTPPVLTEEQIAAQQRRGTFEKRKPGAKVIDQFGDVERKRRRVDMGISDMMLPPYTRKGMATYRVLGTDQISRSTGEPVEPVTVLVPGSYVLYDKFQVDPSKRRVFMKNLGRPDIELDKITGKQVLEENNIDYIEFIRGIKRVETDKNYNLFVFLELHPLNKTNKHRDSSIMPLFERIDLNATRSIVARTALLDLAFEAEEAVIKLDNRERIQSLATSAGVPTMELNKPRAIADIKFDLRHYARSNPKSFFSFGQNLRHGIRITVIDAIEWGMVELANRSFIAPMTEEKFHTHAVGEDPIESLTDFLMKPENTQLHETIKNMVDYYN